ncbi:MAG: FG-GAP repeat domain-containing protein, partial [Planctomycetota bacterium]
MSHIARPNVAALALLLGLCGFAVPLRGSELSFDEHRFPVGGRIDGRIMDDVDGDGRLDLVLFEGRRVVLFLQGPKGFGRWPTQVFMLDPRAMIVHVGDRKDRPGRELVFLAPGGVWAHSWEKGRWAPKPVAWVEGETALRRGSGAALIRRFFTDLDGDGLDDLILPVSGRYVLLRQDEKGKFSRWASLHVDPTVKLWLPRDGRLSVIRRTARYPVPFVVDFDGDGRRDVVVRMARTLHVFLGREDKTFAGEPDLVLETGLPDQKKKLGGRLQLGFEVPLLLGDLQSDGVPDLVACLPLKGEALAFLRGKGKGLGKPGFVFRMDGWPLGAMIKNLDGRLGPDLIIGGVGEIGIWSVLKVFLTKEVLVHAFFFLNRGKGNYPKKPDRTWDVAVPLKFATTAKGFRMGTTLAANFDGDFDGDGRKDLVVRRGNVMLDIFTGTEIGVFSRKPWMSLTIMNAENYRYVFPEVADFNGDGRSDLL